MTETATTGIWHDTDRCYAAVSSRDARFDGRFITGVRTTGIYCRPSCPAITPKRGNVEFFATAAAAQARGFRACRRCLPDAVPGSPDWNVRADLAGRAMRLIAEGTVEREGVPGLARRLGYSERQLGRVLTAELGAGPLALARAHRAHAARLLIERSAMPLTDVAFAAGFASVRQFNDTIRAVFGLTPSDLRTRATSRQVGDTGTPAPVSGATLTLRLPLRPPFDGDGLLSFLAARAVTGVESATPARYTRTLRLPHGPGRMTVEPATATAATETAHVPCELWLTDVRDLAGGVARVRRLLDLDADPVAVDDALRRDDALAPLVAARPGIRVPGAVDGPELVLRTMLGQQVSVAAARTAASRLAAELGENLPGETLPGDALTGDDRSGHDPASDDPADGQGGTALLFPTASAVAEHATDVLRGPRTRIEAIRTVAGALASGDLDVHAGRDPDELRRDLLAQPGIGPWTADYVVMRALGRPDVLLDGDLALRTGSAAAGIDPAELPERALAWRPWRSYAGMQLWRSAATADRAVAPNDAAANRTSAATPNARQDNRHRHTPRHLDRTRPVTDVQEGTP
ncbi:AraC family transcriptional regulator of adaptative response / DNA-3-methyladenine glycosylase II [Prauserella sediminis]|uniref:DNA-3-methyladenine glycosylase II n=1 Tax=Prauserella sediminis TaxID=577680 RepID=A0A839XKK3_9PSEU|nr:AlkA N-terminal domain-containing protein [Prauserella sediminis]MBB3663810.1 AraC family transcriptional regulator of adaptative response / DNA-3-methyladenine glycosylase II [Prauserella sediminis]